MRLMSRFGVALLFLLSLSGFAEATIIGLDARGTYFHTDSIDTGLDAIPIDLISLGLIGGDLIRLRVAGDFAYCRPGTCSADTDTFTFTTAVFSSSPVLLGRDAPHRVPGAIYAGADVVTGLTLFEQEPTDIPEDFELSSFFDVFVEIPIGATHLFAAPPDSFWGDNTDLDGDYGISITQVPEPSSLWLLGAGLATVAASGRRRRRG
jgi:PEP-CTERM motif-containing protein